jgi:hypothetical protein
MELKKLIHMYKERNAFAYTLYNTWQNLNQLLL